MADGNVADVESCWSRHNLPAGYWALDRPEWGELVEVDIGLAIVLLRFTYNMCWLTREQYDDIKRRAH